MCNFGAMMMIAMKVVMISRYMGIRMSQVERTVRKNSDAGGHKNDGGHGDDEKKRDKKRDQLCKMWGILTNKDCNHFIILWSRLCKYIEIQIEKYNST